jgi:hypothetical protein
MSRRLALVAAHRFGVGPRPREADAITGDPRGWLLKQLDRPFYTPAAMKDLPPASDNVADWWDTVLISVAELVSRIRNEYAQLWWREAKARLAAAVVSQTPFHERLVWFRGNHFTVSGRKAKVFALNDAALHGIDPAEVKKKTSLDQVGNGRAACREAREPSHETYGPRTTREYPCSARSQRRLAGLTQHDVLTRHLWLIILLPSILRVGAIMKEITFYACEEDLELIRAEQERLSTAGMRVSQSEAIRSLILSSRVIASNVEAPAPKGLKFFVLPSGKVMSGRAEKVFID